MRLWFPVPHDRPLPVGDVFHRQSVFVDEVRMPDRRSGATDILAEVTATGRDSVPGCSSIPM